MKRSLSAIALSLLAGAAAAQAPAPAAPKPAAPAAAAPAPAAQPAPVEARKPLVLRLDEIEGPRMSIGASPSETFKKSDLPEIGSSKPSPSWTPPPGSTFPKETGSDAY
jgi:hypothetical protein